jgi:GNAT superfamily N-acetyltransferase
VQFERFDPAADPAAARLCHEMYLAGHPVDDPHTPTMSPRAFAGWLALGWSGDHPDAWLARDAAGDACAFYSLTLPGRENTHLGYLAPLVAPPCRRRGIGTRLIRHAAGQAHQRGRTLLASESRQGSPGEGFALALGARQGLTQVTRVLRLGSVPDGHMARLKARAQQAAAGYSLLSWEGAVPDRHLGQMAALVRAAGDAPRNEGEEDQHWDPARVRESGERVAAQGLRYYTVAARHDRTGELAGMTQLGVDPMTPDCGFQELTVVARSHRGHRLGMLVKVAMLELLADHEPLLERIYTGNAGANDHMIAINTELGFSVLSRWLSWELGVTDVLAWPVAARVS